MKKLIYGGLFLASVGIIFVACNKKDIQKNGYSASDSFNAKSTSFSGITVQNGMLSFQSMDHVTSTIDALDGMFLSHEDDFLNANPGKTGEELMDIEEATNFNDFLPYEEFESGFSFTSLRSKIQDEYALYVESGVDEETDPEDHFIDEESVQAILNEYAEVKIGTSIYKFFETGYFKIVDGNYNTLILLRENPSSAIQMSNVEIEGDVDFFMKSEEDCRGHQASYGKYTTGSRRIKWRVKIQTFPWTRYVIAKSKNYIKKNGKWKKFRCHTICRVWGDISDYEVIDDVKVANCNKALTFNTSTGYYSDKYNTKSWKHKVTVATRTKTGWVKGYHSSYIGATTQYNSVLTF